MNIGVITQIMRLEMSTESGKEELQAVKEAYNQLEEEHKQLSISAVHKAKEIHNSEVGWFRIHS